MLLCRISCELAGCVHQPIVGSGQTNFSHLYFSRLSLAMTAKLNFFKTPTSVPLVQVGPCPLPLEYQAASSHTGRQPCLAKSLYLKRFWCHPPPLGLSTARDERDGRTGMDFDIYLTGHNSLMAEIVRYNKLIFTLQGLLRQTSYWLVSLYLFYLMTNQWPFFVTVQKLI